MVDIKKDESTAAQRRIPFYVSLDGVNGATGLSFATSDLKVSKAGAAPANSAGTVSETGLGVYYYNATAAEVDTFGILTIYINKSGYPASEVYALVTSDDPYTA